MNSGCRSDAHPFQEKRMPFGKPAAGAPGAKKTAPAKAVKKVAAKKKAAKKAGPILFKAPEDHKPAFFEVEFETLRDGLIRGGSIVVNRVKGKWDNPDAPRFNLAEYDVATLLGIATRLGAMSSAPNIAKRLAPKSKFGLILRVNKRSKDGSIAVGYKGAKFLGVGKGDKPKWFWVNAKSTGEALMLHRRMRKMTRFLAGAFVEVQLPPSKRKKKAAEEEG